VDFAFSDEQEALREAARSFLAEHGASARVRAAMASDAGHDPETWKRMGAELGWTAVAIPEDCGGLGLGAVELALLCEAMGEVVLPSPFFATACLATPALLVAADEAQRGALLPALAEGARTATLAVPGPGGSWDASGVAATARRDGEGFVLDGGWRYVPDGHRADLLVLAARERGTRGEAGLSLFAVPAADAEAAGLVRRRLPTLDPTRPLAELEARALRVPAEALLGGFGEAAPALRRALDLAAVALSAELVGVAQRALDLAVAHAKERVQFGRPIGAFQAVKHRCADMMVRAESARSAVLYAACVAAEGTSELAQAASLAKATASEAAFFCAAESLQVHGGAGFTWEMDVHLLLKRARAGEALLGDPAWHRERVARQLLGAPDAPAEASEPGSRGGAAR